MKKDTGLIIACVFFLIMLVLFMIAVMNRNDISIAIEESGNDAKPVIYLYPPEETEISVELDYDGELTCTSPAYEDGWHVSAAPDGTLTDAAGQTYN